MTVPAVTKSPSVASRLQPLTPSSTKALSTKRISVIANKTSLGFGDQFKSTVHITPSFKSTTTLDRLLNDRSQPFGKPLQANNAVIRDLVNNNYQLEYLQTSKHREESFRKNIDAIMARIHASGKAGVRKHLDKMEVARELRIAQGGPEKHSTSVDFYSRRPERYEQTTPKPMLFKVPQKKQSSLL